MSGLVGLALWAWSSNAVASPEIVWTAPRGCPTEDQFLRRIEGYLGAPLSSLGGQLAVRLEVSPRGRSWRVRIAGHEGDARGERELEGRSCQEVAEASALIVALIIRPEPASQPAQPASLPAAMPPSATLPRAKPSPHTWLLRLAGRADAGSVGGLAPGLDAAAAVERAGIRIELRAAYLGPLRSTSANRQDAGADVSLWTVGLGACLDTRVGLACTGAEGGQLMGQGFGVTPAKAGNSTWLAIAVGLTERWSVYHLLRVVAGLEAFLPLWRPSFVVDGAEVHRPAAVGGRALLGMELTIP